MTTLRKAAQQALEALEYRDGDGADQWKADVITALKAALAEPEPRNQCAETCERAKLCAVCARGLAEPVQEPVRLQCVTCGTVYADGVPPQVPPQVPVQEPVAWLSRDDARLALWEAINKREFGNPTDDKLILDHLHQQGLWIGKYTAPPHHKPLTDEEIEQLLSKYERNYDMVNFARAIEKAHGIE